MVKKGLKSINATCAEMMVEVLHVGGGDSYAASR